MDPDDARDTPEKIDITLKLLRRPLGIGDGEPLSAVWVENFESEMACKAVVRALLLDKINPLWIRSSHAVARQPLVLSDLMWGGIQTGVAFCKTSAKNPVVVNFLDPTQSVSFPCIRPPRAAA